MNRKHISAATINGKRSAITAFLLSCLVLVTFTACRKERPQATYVEYYNNTFTPILITAGGITKTIPVGSTITYQGTLGGQVSGTATTAGSTSSGAIIGLPVTWSFATLFPGSGVAPQDLDVTSDFFFLEIVNNSADVITTVYVNYGLQSQTIDNLTIPNDGRLYAVGYYPAYTNSNVRFEAANGDYVLFTSLGLPFTLNQTITLTAN